jgi:DNA-binding NarL/FixJ family response regulator
LPRVTPVVEETALPHTSTLIEPLTPRELDALRLLSAGYSNGEIAAELGIAVGTVKFYTSQIYGKLGVRNRVMAVARARELNLVSDK